MRTLIGHRDIETTQRYVDYAPAARDAELVAIALRRAELDSEPVPHEWDRA